MIGPSVLVLLLWWATPGKVEGLQDYLRASGPAFTELSARAVGYYWSQVILSFTANPLVGALTLALCALAAVRRRDGGTRLLLAIVAVTWIGLMLKRSLKLRFFLEAYPALCLLGARGAADLGRRVTDHL